jgi:hypothetical protein
LLSIFGAAGVVGIIIAVFIFAPAPQFVCGTQLTGLTLFGSWRWAGTFQGNPQTGLFTFNNNCTYTDIAKAGSTISDEANFFVSDSPASINFTNKDSGQENHFLITNISENSFHASSRDNTTTLEFTKAS